MSLFHGPTKMPDLPAKVPMFRSTAFESMSHRDEKYQRAFAARVKQAMRQFGFKNQPSEEGSRVVFTQEEVSLHLYRASDSLWWSDSRYCNGETVTAGQSLPEEKAAAKRATEELERVKLDASESEVSSIDYNEVAIQQGNKRPRLLPTALNVNLGFSLADIPVFVPPAKIKVSYVGQELISQIIYVWRKPAKAAVTPILNAEEALDQFRRDPAFLRLKPEEAVVEIRGMQLGYYALPPGDFQR